MPPSSSVASITYWNRLEPRSRSADIRPALRAEIHDPLWMLTRQWQAGEFQGEDAASPASIELTTRSQIANGWRALTTGAAAQYSVQADGPLEFVFQRETIGSRDLALASELGLLLGDLLVEQLGNEAEPALQAIRARFPLPGLSGDDSGRPVDTNARAFLGLCAGRIVDGSALALRVKTPDARAGLVAALELDARLQERVRAAIDQFADCAAPLVLPPRPTSEDPVAWDPSTLRYQAALTSGPRSLSITPDRDGFADWWSFVQQDAPAPLSGGSVNTRRMYPGNVRIRGMPNARWWDFESSATDFGDVQAERRDLARMALVGFMLVQSNDWFMIPFPMHVGTFCQVERLRVHDVFGGQTDVPRAETHDRTGTQRWTMFTTSTRSGELATYFHLPPSASATRMDGPVLEEVQFLRDEMANMAWAIEHTMPSRIGEPVEYSDRSAENGQALATPTTPPPGEPSLSWRLQSIVPDHWYPLLPAPVPGRNDEIVLQLGRTALASRSELEQAPPSGRILRPRAGTGAMSWREEEIPRDGVRLRLRCVRSRWIDGSTQVWISRSRQLGSGEGSSGLRFDEAIFRRDQPASADH